MFYILLILSAAMIGALIGLLVNDDWGDRILFGVSGSILGIMIALLLSLLVSLIVDDVVDKQYLKEEEISIIALQDGSSTNGRFFLGSGSFDGTMKYVYMTSNSGEMKMSSINVDNVALIYSNTTKIETYKSHYKSKAVKYWFGDNSWDRNIYKIYIPEGSVKQNFNVDLQ
jgi:hypothetical protein